MVFTTLGLVIFAVYLWYTNPFSALTEVGRFNPSIYFIAVMVNYVGLVFMSGSWYVLLRALDIKINFWRAIQMTFTSLFVVWMIPIPSGVEFIRAYLVKNEEGSNLGKAISSVMVAKVYYFISFGVFITLGAVIVTVLRGDSIPVRPELVWFVVLFALLNTLLFGILLTPDLLRHVYGKSPDVIKRHIFNRIYDPDMGLGGFPAFIDELEVSVDSLKKRPILNVLSLLMIGFHWSTGSITAYLVAQSLGKPTSFWLIVLIYAVIEFIQQLNFIIPSGLGVVDAGLTGAFVIIGVPLSLASAISLLTRLATYWLELILCGAVSFQFGYREALKDYYNR
jgi:uncharacterized protein (TIRG00374 family)